ncbi:SMC1 [Symbiodinium sp. CCMP2592]|nr:SMC1 [Symbiodinium sp. CCMP2592]
MGKPRHGTLSISFECDPAESDELVAATQAELDCLKDGSTEFTEANVAAALEQDSREFEELIHTNGWWAGTMLDLYFSRCYVAFGEIGKQERAARFCSHTEYGGLAVLCVYSFQVRFRDIGENGGQVCRIDPPQDHRWGILLPYASLKHYLHDGDFGLIVVVRHKVGRNEPVRLTHWRRAVRIMTDRHCSMEHAVKRVTDIRKHLELLEGKFATATFSTSSSTRTTAGGGPDSNNRPAVVVGGWDADQSASDTLRMAKEHIASLEIDLDTEEAFVPGLRRGFAIVPVNNRSGESDMDFRAAMSESPERRKRAQFAGKVKRLVLELDGDKRQLDVEFGTGNIWHGQVRVASAVSTAPIGAASTRVGWVHLATIASQMGVSDSSLTTKWDELRKALS